jgi:TonB family protein
MNAYAQQDYSLFSRRTLAFLLIVGLHGILIFALANGLTHGMISVIPQRLQGTFLVEPKTRDVPLPPLRQPTLAPRTFEFQDPGVKVNFPPDDPRTIQDAIPLLEGGGAPPPSPPRAVNRVLGGPGRAFPNTNDFYPPEAIRGREKGVATVRSCVDDKGRLTAAPTLAQTSGSASLDAGALKLAKAGSGHYRATTEDGHPVNSCYEFRIRFDFRD